jgi:hypothetical protein
LIQDRFYDRILRTRFAGGMLFGIAVGLAIGIPIDLPSLRAEVITAGLAALCLCGLAVLILRSVRK